MWKSEGKRCAFFDAFLSPLWAFSSSFRLWVLCETLSTGCPISGGGYDALQNRLGHNINDLGQARENITEAESRIRDADMAEEYVQLVKLNILQQSSQAMMFHSNEDTERVLQLLQ